MLNSLMSSWQEFTNAPVGHRFQKRYERRMRQSKGKFCWGKMINIVVGIAIIILGVILIPAPGPGAMITLFGAGLIAGEFLRPCRSCVTTLCQARCRSLEVFSDGRENLDEFWRADCFGDNWPWRVDAVFRRGVVAEDWVIRLGGFKLPYRAKRVMNTQHEYSKT